MNTHQPWASFDNFPNNLHDPSFNFVTATPSFTHQQSFPLPPPNKADNTHPIIAPNDRLIVDNSCNRENTVATDSRSCGLARDPWAMTPDQKAYYLAQFLRLQPDPSGHLSGLQAKGFFELSKLLVNELSDIWELSDVDADGQLTLSEFSVAMHLVVLRRNNVILPAQLPETLLREATSSALSAVNPKSCLLRQSPPLSTLSQTEHESEARDVPDGLVCRSRLHASGEYHSFDSHLEASTDASNKDSYLMPRQRRWSTSSDAISLAEGLIAFDGRLAPNAEIYHPVPLRQPMVLPVPVTRTDAVTGDREKVAINRDTSIVAAPLILSRHPSGPPPHQSSSASNRPPTPPPRARAKTLTLPTHAFGVQPDDPPQCDATDNRSHKLSSILLPLQSECERVLQENNSLTEELVMLQKQRIAMEILLERLMPLEA